MENANFTPSPAAKENLEIVIKRFRNGNLTKSQMLEIIEQAHRVANGERENKTHCSMEDIAWVAGELEAFMAPKASEPIKGSRELLTPEEAKDPKIFGRFTQQGHVILLYAKNGDAVTRVWNWPHIYPVGSHISCAWEHPEGIVLRHADAIGLGIEIEE